MTSIVIKNVLVATSLLIMTGGQVAYAQTIVPPPTNADLTPSSDALAASARTDGNESKVRLKNPAAFGLLGQLVDHIFRRFTPSGEIEVMQILAADDRTVAFNVIGADTQRALRLDKDGRLYTLFRMRELGWKFLDGKNDKHIYRKVSANTLPEPTAGDSLGLNARGDLVPFAPNPSPFKTYFALKHQPSMTPAQAHELAALAEQRARLLCDGAATPDLEICANIRAGALAFSRMAGETPDRLATLQASAEKAATAANAHRDAERAEIEAERARNQADNQLAVQQQIETLAATLSNIKRDRSVVATAGAAPQIAQNTEVKASERFGPLPDGVGNDAQKSFWTSRCQGRVNDASPEAQGCAQTLSTLRTQAATAAHSYAGTATTQTGSLYTAKAAQQATHVTCVSMRKDKTTSLGFWEVVNGCPYRVSGTFKYSDGYSGGFGPLGSGKTETVSPPSKGVTSYSIKACIYDEWLSGICK